MNKFIVSILVLLSMPQVFPQSLINKDDSPLQVFLEAELGTVKINYHTLLNGDEDLGTGTTFDLVNQGGQEILFPFQRFTAGFELKNQHRISFLYQPLELNTKVVFREDVVVNNVTFASGTAMEIKYGFPFYRITYGYDLYPQENLDLVLGGALQLRNASIVFQDLSGNAMTVSQNLGPVPAIHFLARYHFESGLYVMTDITGLYASSAIINGADFEFEGSILDASLRAGWTLKPQIDLFMNLRFLGGSAAGVSQYESTQWSTSQERATANYLATTAFTLGATLR